MNEGEGISILVLTEDSGEDGFKTIHALLLAMLRKIEPAAQLEYIEIEPTQNANALRSVRGNFWKSDKEEDRRFRVDLVRVIATKLAEGGFVVFHFDGDQPWRRRKRNENREKFRELMEWRIRESLREQFDRKFIDAAMKRLLLVVPHYSIESWLFQNTTEAIRLCHEKHSGKSVRKFEEWAEDRRALDEVTKPKEEVCFRGQHNATLATKGFPFDLAHDVGKSLKQAVDTLRSCDDLTSALDTLKSA